MTWKNDSFNFMDPAKYAKGTDVIINGITRLYLTYPKRQKFTIPKNVTKRLSISDTDGIIW